MDNFRQGKNQDYVAFNIVGMAQAMCTDQGIKELCNEIKIQTVGNATILSET